MHHAWPPIPSFIVWLTNSSHLAKKQRDFARKHKVLVLIRGALFFAKREKQKKSKDFNPRYGPSTGSVEARTAVAKHVSVPGGEVLHPNQKLMIPIYLSLSDQSDLCDHGLSLALTN